MLYFSPHYLAVRAVRTKKSGWQEGSRQDIHLEIGHVVSADSRYVHRSIFQLPVLKRDAVPSTAPSAASKVFGIYELVEQILIDLGRIDARSVFALQRVNKGFSATVEKSKKLRRVICLDVVLDGEEEPRPWYQGPELNPLCFDKRIGGLLFPALLNAWTNPHERVSPVEMVRLSCFPGVQKNAISARYGSWRHIVFAQTEKNYPVSMTMSNEKTLTMFSVSPQVYTHTTLGEIVDKYDDMLRSGLDPGEIAWEENCGGRFQGHGQCSLMAMSARRLSY